MKKEHHHQDRIIYLASPYTDPDPAIMEQRYLVVAKSIADLTLQGHLVFSPIVQFHSIAVAFDLPKNFGFYQKFNMAMLSRCDELAVLRLPGWKESVGVQNEIRMAGIWEMPIAYL